MHDLRFALRTLARSPGYTAIVILALALGIGATTAVYSVVDGVLLRPLPYRESDRILVINSSHPQRGNRVPPSYLDWRDWRERSKTLDEIGFARGDMMMLATGDGLRRVLAGFTSDGFFDVFGSAPALGRTFTAEEEMGTGPRVVVLGHGLWMEQLGGDRTVLGRTLRLDGESYIVVGVMPRGFRAPDFAQLWTPLAPHLAGDPGMERRSWRVDNRVFGRLAAGVSLMQATEEMDRISAQLGAEHPATNEDWSAELSPLREEVIRGVHTLLGLLLGASAVVLLIACFNVANLALVRASARMREMAVRASLGAGRAHLARQLLVESLMLALAGGVLGVLLAWWGVDLLVRAAPGILPRIDEVAVDARILVASMVLVLSTAVVFGLAPARRATRLDLARLLREGSAGGGGRARGARRVRSALVVAQTALALVLLVGAGLLLRSFYNVVHVDPGFRIERLVTMRILPPAERYGTTDALVALYDRLRESVAAIPGVRSTALINHLPLAASGVPTDLRVPGRAESELPVANAMYRTASDGYVETMQMRVIAGRVLGAADMTTTSNAIMVNQTLASSLWPEQAVVGQRLTVFKQVVGRDDYREPIEGEIVGVVADVRPFGPDQQAPPEVFVPLRRNPWSTVYLAVRTSGEASAIVDRIRRAALAIEPNLPTDDLRTMEQRLDQSLAQRRMTMMLLATFALIALSLAAIGMYGVVAYAVSQRTREIGIRMALGAEPGRVLVLVLREGLLLGTIGIALGAAGALAVTRLLTRLLFEVEPSDPLVFAGIGLLLLGVAAAASLIPARRAATVDPVRALRSE